MEKPEIRKKYILRCIVGSQAHGLATPESDTDYRGVFAVPTTEILKVNAKIKSTNWVEGKEDNTSWEIGHFLNMAVHCNPTILEVFAAPVVEIDKWGEMLRDIFPSVWNSKGVMDAFCGYGLNQRKKMLEDKDRRANKYAVAYLRVLAQAEHLLLTGEMMVNFGGHEVFETLKSWRFAGDNLDFGEVVNVTKEWEENVCRAFEQCKQVPDVDKVNEFLLRYRKYDWYRE